MPQPSVSVRSRVLRWLPAALIVLAALVHLPTLDAPLLERHGFRQTQTAFTARIFHEDGIDLLHPMLPVLGPPWEVPFEFPLFQAAAAVVMNAGLAEDTALRVTGLASFVLAAWLLWLLVRRQAGDLAAIIALGVFAFSPMAIEWSRAALIEYLALAATLAFALAGLRWRERPTAAWYGAALVLGSVAALVKITTAAFWIAPFALLGFGRDDVAQTRRSRAAAWGLSILPLLAGVAWTRYTDAIKAGSAATADLSSGEMVLWNFGDLAERVDASSWARVVVVIVLAGGVILPFVVVPLIRFARRERQGRFWTWIAVTLIGPVLVFFNLYVNHDYYAIAISASLAAIIGVGVAALRPSVSRVDRVVLPTILAASVVVWLLVLPYWAPIYQRVSDPEGVLPLAAQIERETSDGQPVSIVGRNWSPAILYYAHRWGWMETADDWPPGMVERLLADGYALYRCPPGPERDHCDRVTDPTGGVPVPITTFGAVTASTGLLESVP